MPPSTHLSIQSSKPQVVFYSTHLLLPPNPVQPVFSHNGIWKGGLSPSEHFRSPHLPRLTAPGNPTHLLTPSFPSYLHRVSLGFRHTPPPPLSRAPSHLHSHSRSTCTRIRFLLRKRERKQASKSWGKKWGGNGVSQRRLDVSVALCDKIGGKSQV